MAPIVRSLPLFVKDSQYALQIVRDFNFLGEDKLIFTMDISSLYTVIPNAIDYKTPVSLLSNKGVKFLKKLWCCVGGSITR